MYVVKSTDMLATVILLWNIWNGKLVNKDIMLYVWGLWTTTDIMS